MSPEPTPPRRMPPPSFTPQSGRPARPSVRDAAIEVPDTGEQPQTSRARPALSSNAPRAGASGRVPARVTRPAETPAGSRPPSLAPDRPSRRPVSEAGAGAAGGSAASRTPTSGSGTPVSYAPAARTARPGATDASRTGTPAQPAGRQVSSSPHARPAVAAASPQRTGTRRPPSGPGGGVPGARPAGPTPPSPPRAGDATAGPRRRPRWRRLAAVSLALLLVCVIAWPVGLALWANGKINHIDALSTAPATSGTTYLLAGSDSRADGAIGEDGTEGARTDTILVLHVPDSGPTSLISLPRDTYAQIPGRGASKLNAAYSWGGAPLLVQTVEGLTGMKVDHYVEVGLGGVEDIVDAVGGVNLCLDYDVNDPNSGLVWTSGCHETDGTMARAFSRPGIWA